MELGNISKEKYLGQYWMLLEVYWDIYNNKRMYSLQAVDDEAIMCVDLEGFCRIFDSRY